MIHDNEDEIHTKQIDKHGDPIPELTPTEQERRDKVWEQWFRKEREKAEAKRGKETQCL